MKITKEQSFEENRKFFGFIKECPTSYQTVNKLLLSVYRHAKARKDLKLYVHTLTHRCLNSKIMVNTEIVIHV